jgi:membrane protein DedA with SNARE-associated domain
MHPILVTLHSYNRYLLLVAIAFVLYRSLSGWLSNKPYEKTDNAASAALLGLTHLQLLLGLILYFFTSAYTTGGGSMSDPWVRYFKAEHIASMLIAVILIQLGRTFSKKATIDVEKHKKVAIYTAFAALIIVGTLAMKGLLFGTLASAVGGE